MAQTELRIDRAQLAMAAIGVSAIYAASWIALAAHPATLPIELAIAAGLAVALVVSSLIDLASLRLPDWLTLPLIPAGWLAGVALQGADTLPRLILGAAGGYLLLAGVAALYRVGRGRAGLGLGDAKLYAAAGAWVGPEGLAPVLLAACLLALATLAGATWFTGKSVGPATRLPFGPAIAIGFWVVWLMHGSAGS